MLVELHGAFCFSSRSLKVRLPVPKVSKPVLAEAVLEAEEEEEEEEDEEDEKEEGDEEEDVVGVTLHREVEDVRSSTAACRAGRPSRVAFILLAVRSSSAQMQISVTCPLSKLCTCSAQNQTPHPSSSSVHAQVFACTCVHLCG